VTHTLLFLEPLVEPFRGEDDISLYLRSLENYFPNPIIYSDDENDIAPIHSYSPLKSEDRLKKIQRKSL
jgi:hypothetical protein